MLQFSFYFSLIFSITFFSSCLSQMQWFKTWKVCPVSKHFKQKLNLKAYALKEYYLCNFLLDITYMPYLYVFVFGLGSKGNEREKIKNMILVENWWNYFTYKIWVDSIFFRYIKFIKYGRPVCHLELHKSLGFMSNYHYSLSSYHLTY